MSTLTQRAAIVMASCFCLMVAGVVGWPGGNGLGKRPLRVARSPERGSELGRDASAGVPAQALPTDPRAPAMPGTEPGAAASQSPFPASVTLRGRVVLLQGFFGCKAEVWNLNERSYASTDGSFELSGDSVGQPLQATLRGFQPAREERVGEDGIVLRLGPPALSITGRVTSEEGRESEGWRIALLDATLIEPVRSDAATLESASSRSPLRVQCSADGSFTVDGLSPRPYTLAAWRAARERIELHAAAPATPEQGPIEIQVPPAGACRTIELRCVDSQAAPLARLRVGLPGAPAIAATDEQGKLVLTGALPPRVTLIVSMADGRFRSLPVDTAASADLLIELP